MDPKPRPDWDPIDPDVANDPIAAYASLRSRCPVAYSDRWGGFWSITGFDDVVSAARDVETFSSLDAPAIPPIDFGQDGPLAIPAQLDPPQARTYRQLFAPYFAPKLLETMTEEFRELLDSYLQPLLERGHGEFVEEFAYPYPASVISQCVLRAPVSDWKLLKDRLDEVLHHARTGNADGMVEVGRAMDTYLAKLVRDRRTHPLDPKTDLISGLIAAEVDGKALDEGMIAAIGRSVFLAGHETTATALGSAIFHLATHQEDQDRLRADPDLIPTAIEELLRCYSPVAFLGRRATRDVELHGRKINSGETVGLMWLSANHDPRKFPMPDVCQFDRTPNRHIAFGFGQHHCLGAPLARVELRIALGTLLERTSGFELDGPVESKAGPGFGLQKLPISLQTK